LDPYSDFLTTSELEDVENQTKLRNHKYRSRFNIQGAKEVVQLGFTVCYEEYCGP